MQHSIAAKLSSSTPTSLFDALKLGTKGTKVPESFPLFAKSITLRIAVKFKFIVGAKKERSGEGQYLTPSRRRISEGDRSVLFSAQEPSCSEARCSSIMQAFGQATRSARKLPRRSKCLAPKLQGGAIL